MRKMSVLLAIGMALLLAGCSAEAQNAEYLPEGARLVREETDDGLKKEIYQGTNGEEYELLIDADGVVRALEADLNVQSQSSEVSLTAEQAFQSLSEKYPNARLISAYSDTDDGRAEWSLLFANDDVLYEYELDAGTGAVLSYKEFYKYTQETDPTRNILASYPTAVLYDLDFGMEAGRTVFDGDAMVNGIHYEFEVDASTGEILEWKIDD